MSLSFVRTGRAIAGIAHEGPQQAFVAGRSCGRRLGWSLSRRGSGGLSHNRWHCGGRRCRRHACLHGCRSGCAGRFFHRRRAIAAIAHERPQPTFAAGRICSCPLCRGYRRRGSRSCLSDNGRHCGGRRCRRRVCLYGSRSGCAGRFFHLSRAIAAIAHERPQPTFAAGRICCHRLWRRCRRGSRSRLCHKYGRGRGRSLRRGTCPTRHRIGRARFFDLRGAFA